MISFLIFPKRWFLAFDFFWKRIHCFSEKSAFLKTHNTMVALLKCHFMKLIGRKFHNVVFIRNFLELYVWLKVWKH